MEIKNFAIIKGIDAIIDNGHIKLPAPKKETSNDEVIVKKSRPVTEVRSDFSFTNGTIEFKFKTSSHKTGIVLLFRTIGDEGISIGLSKTFDTFVIANGTHIFTPLCSAGSFKNYKINEEHKIKIEVIGSTAKLFMNDILLCSNTVNIKETLIEFRLSSEGSVEVYDVKVNSIKPKVFVVMQFSKEYNELFENVIKPITEKAGYECVRADEFYTSTPILKDIIESIQNSTVIIAEITPDNPNVFYEIGYSHAINKPTILLSDIKREKLPFDLSSFRTLFYENTIAGKKKVEESLAKYLENIK